jgi:membrane protease YdiL (CAAX protease family)
MHSGGAKPGFMERIRAPEQPPGWKLSTALFFAGAFVVVWLASVSVVSVAGGEIQRGSLSVNALTFSALLSGTVLILGVMQWAQRRVGARWIVPLRMESVVNSWVTLTGLACLAIAWAIDLAGVLLALKSVQSIPPLADGLREPFGVIWVLGILVLVVVQPVAEGLVFAGIIYPALSSELKDNRAAIVATALLYGLLNAVLAARQDSWYAFVQPCLMALTVFIVRAYTQSTRMAIVARGAFGVFFVLAALISRGIP